MNTFNLIELHNLDKDTKTKLKSSGIYRIFITNPKTQNQQSYIGISVNIYARLSKHKTLINATLNNDKRLIKDTGEYKNFTNYLINFIKFNSVSANYAFYQKLFMKLIEFNLSLENVKFEILEFIPNYKNLDIFTIEEKEQTYITKYNSERQGFNGIFNYEFKYMRYIRYSKDELLIKKVEKQKIKKSQQRKETIINALKNNEVMNEWIYWQIKDFDNWMNMQDSKVLTTEYNKHNIYERYCSNIISKTIPFFTKKLNNSKIKVKQMEEQLDKLKPITKDQLTEKLKMIQTIKYEINLQSQRQEVLINILESKGQKRLKLRTGKCNECFNTFPKSELLKFGIRPLTNTLFCKECYNKKHKTRKNKVVIQNFFYIVVVVIIMVIIFSR